MKIYIYSYNSEIPYLASTRTSLHMHKVVSTLINRYKIVK